MRNKLSFLYPISATLSCILIFSLFLFVMRPELIKDSNKSFEQRIDPTFFPFVSSFIKAGDRNESSKRMIETRLPNLKIYLKDPTKFGANLESICFPSTNTILISPIFWKTSSKFWKTSSKFWKTSSKFWKTSSKFFKQVILDHELGHCLLKRIHRNRTKLIDKNIYPLSIMYPILLSEKRYLNYDELRKELFDPARIDTIDRFEELVKNLKNQNKKELEQEIKQIENSINNDRSIY